jgi:hypothetical protein
MQAGGARARGKGMAFCSRCACLLVTGGLTAASRVLAAERHATDRGTLRGAVQWRGARGILGTRGVGKARDGLGKARDGLGKARGACSVASAGDVAAQRAGDVAARRRLAEVVSLCPCLST